MIFSPPGPIAAAFLRDRTPICIIEGPIESGKSSTSAAKLMQNMCLMPRDRQGIRRSRWLVTRETYPDLRGSTANTWLDWFKPEVYGKFTESEPYIHTIAFRDVRAEVVFESYLDDSDDTISSLRSKEYTGAWINECQFTPRRLFFEIASRTGRYPKLVDIKHNLPEGGGLSQCVIADHNAPFVNDHWIRYMRGDVPLPIDMPPEERLQYMKPANVKFFKQPPALLQVFGPDGKTTIGYEVNPTAENVRNMRGGITSTIELEKQSIEASAAGKPPPQSHRYIELVGGKTGDEIDRDLLGKVARVKRGAPATPGFRMNRHVTAASAKPIEGIAVGIGGDHGLTPAVVFVQRIGQRWFVFDEIVEMNKTTNEFAPLVRTRLMTEYPWVGGEDGCGYYAWGDPAGDWQGQTDRNTTFQIYAAHDIIMRSPWPKDKPQLRLSAVRSCLATNLDDGEPKLQIHPRCKYLIAALDGGAQMRQQKTPDGMRTIEQIIKNAHSHVLEALTYVLAGGGEGELVLRPSGPKKASVVNVIKKNRRIITLGRRGYK